jgi:adenylate cyclase
MSKTLACEVILSEDLRVTAGLTADGLPLQEVEIRGRVEPMIVRSVMNARLLSALVDDVDVTTLPA